MKLRPKAKWMVLACLLAAVALLSGCVTSPNQPDKGGNSGAGYSGDLPFDILQYTTIPPASVTPTAGFGITTPEPEDGPTDYPFSSPGFGVPSFSPMTPAPGSTATPPPTSPPTITPKPSPTPLVLKLGSTGPSVRALQSKLRELGYMRTIDGDFGKGTENAVKAFQTRNRLRADGVAGPATLARINAANAVRAPVTAAPTRVPPRATATPQVHANVYLKLGSSGADVRRMQSRLIELGYLSGTATGQFNAATEAAVIAFQKRNVAYYDGIAGPMTLSKLYSNSAVRSAGGAASIGIKLEIGMKNSEAVRTMQRRLKDLRYYTGAIDGDFGPSTEVAVRAFQTNNRLRIDGKAGEETLNTLYSSSARRADNPAPGVITPNVPRVTPLPSYTPIVNYVNVTPAPDGKYVILQYGDGGALVQNLQQALKNRGYFSSTVDGKYGLATVEAVTRFQADFGLSQDGKAGPATQRTLFEGNFPIGS